AENPNREISDFFYISEGGSKHMRSPNISVSYGGECTWRLGEIGVLVAYKYQPDAGIAYCPDLERPAYSGGGTRAWYLDSYAKSYWDGLQNGRVGNIYSDSSGKIGYATFTHGFKWYTGSTGILPNYTFSGAPRIETY